MSEPLVAAAAACPQCGSAAEPEEDGASLWYACTECGAEFGYQPVPQAAPVCAAGFRFSDIPVVPDPAQPPGLLSLESGAPRASVFLGNVIRRRAE